MQSHFKLSNIGIGSKNDLRNPKQRDYTPPLARSQNENPGKKVLYNKLDYPNYFSPGLNVEEKNVLVQTLSPRKLKYYEEKNTLTGLKENRYSELEINKKQIKDIENKTKKNKERKAKGHNDYQVEKHNLIPKQQYYC